jgi:hypothetical protein
MSDASFNNIIANNASFGYLHLTGGINVSQFLCSNATITNLTNTAPITFVTITASNVYSTMISGSTIYANTLTSGSITAQNIYGNAITGTTIYAQNLTGANIYGNEITGTTIYATTINATNISAANIYPSTLGYNIPAIITSVGQATLSTPPNSYYLVNTSTALTVTLPASISVNTGTTINFRRTVNTGGEVTFRQSTNPANAFCVYTSGSTGSTTASLLTTQMQTSFINYGTTWYHMFTI